MLKDSQKQHYIGLRFSLAVFQLNRTILQDFLRYLIKINEGKSFFNDHPFWGKKLKFLLDENEIYNRGYF